ncbi:pyocin knob domain-containing S74 family peptidase [Achromobacter deleyi]|uniref:pyocin knob domain-containing S74 family peptidase n=1 Tax=Achromobacter deleyi TaxID=1353891 RepID=UPI001468E8E9|nr:pyocin knob domain-containing S74 family peptidase [Achromobacter deleyi]CAB3848718.1 hypothetical protein LMG3412_01634 [Achromobacter deleyi]
MANTQPINVGKTDNDQTGDPLRVALQKVNGNFTQVQAALDAVWNAAPLGAAVDLNTVIAPGRYHQSTNAAAQTGSNYPLANAGFLEVGASGDGAFVYQEYTQYRSGAYSRRFWRSFYGGTWAAWQELAPLSQKGAANGLATLDASGKVPVGQIPAVYSAVLPTTAHDLNEYVTPGSFYQTTVAGATEGANYPVANVGFLEVTATGTPVVQVYTTRTNVPAAMQRFWRVRVSTTSWSVWKELADTATVVSYAGGMIAAQDLNSYTQRGLWAVGGSAIAAGGSNFPVGQSGYLLVMSASPLGGPGVTSGVCQVYYAANGNKVYNRSLINGNWSPWVASLDSSQLAAPGGVASLDGDGKIPVLQIPSIPATSLTVTHDLNTVVSQGDYYVPVAAITGGSNMPSGLTTSALLNVSAYGNAVRHTLTSFGQNGESWWRMRTGSSTWGPWRQMVDVSQALTRTTLAGTGVDANTLIGAETYYVFNATVMSSGKNFPPCSAVGGEIYTSNIGSANVIQTAMLNFGNTNQHRPAVYRRRGGGSPLVWGVWTIAEPLSVVGQLPTEGCGDVHVDGLGLHRWNGTAYTRFDPPVAADLSLLQSNARILGNWTWNLADTNVAGFKKNGTGPTYVQAFPATGSAISGWIANSAEGPNRAYTALRIDGQGGVVSLESVGTGTSPTLPLVFRMGAYHAGRITPATTWVLGPDAATGLYCRTQVTFDGAGSQYGTVYRPTQDGSTLALVFQSFVANTVGSILTTATATVFNTTSDYRVKHDVVDMGGAWALESVLRMRPVRYKWNADNSNGEGFIAHELQAEAPDAVSGEKDAMLRMPGMEEKPALQGVDPSKIVARLVAAVQEQQRQILALTQRVELLEGRSAVTQAMAMPSDRES